MSSWRKEDKVLIYIIIYIAQLIIWIKIKWHFKASWYNLYKLLGINRIFFDGQLNETDYLHNYNKNFHDSKLLINPNSL